MRHLKNFNEKFGITKDIPYLCETNNENMTYNKENWGKKDNYGNYPKHPFVGKNVQSILEIDLDGEYDWDWEDGMDDLPDNVKNISVWGSNDKGYWGLMNGDDRVFYAENDEKIKFLAGIPGDLMGIRVIFDTLFVGGHDGVEMYNLETGESSELF
jgi:hypothetical protein